MYFYLSRREPGKQEEAEEAGERFGFDLKPEYRPIVKNLTFLHTFAFM
jgi:hypothetical protein